jgi:hypothetical protein|tara:strand:- start:1017 stop:1520 length:504 start_codon:yes stop_codon:yes gene_type:complete
MKKVFLTLGMMLMTAGAAQAGGLVHSMSSSVQLTVDSARSTATRLGNQYSVSGSNVGTSDGTTAGVLSTGTISSGVYAPGTISASQLSATDGEAFSFSTSFLQGDALSTSAPTVGEVPNYSSVTSYTAGTAGNLAGTIGTDGAIAITAGGAGSSATGQFVSEITVID